MAVAEQSGTGFAVPGGDGAVRLRQLARVTALLAVAESLDTVSNVVAGYIADAVNAAVATLMLREDDRLVLTAAFGVRQGIEDQFSSFRIADRNPASEAARFRRVVVLPADSDIEGTYPVLAGTVPAGRSLVCVPLLAGDDTVGVLGLTFEGGWTPGPSEIDLLTTFADGCAQAIMRVRSTQRLTLHADQMEFMAEASRALAADLDYSRTLSRVAELAVPKFADWCTVVLEQGQQLVTVAVAHEEPERVEWAWQLQDRYPPEIEAPTGAAEVLRSRRGELYPVITDDMLVAGARDEEHLALSRQIGLQSAMIVPLLGRDRCFGVLSLFRTRNPGFTTPELQLAEDLGRRAGMAIENALLYRQARSAALQLQHAVLPTNLQDLTGQMIATIYSPGGDSDVGGDFFDALPCGQHKTAITIGDVTGHGIEAAADMAQMRASIRAYVALDPEPKQVASRLDALFDQLHISRLVSMVYAVLDHETGQMSMINAGHYSPLLVPAVGAAWYLEMPAETPVGIPTLTRHQKEFTLDPGDTVLFFTDGLIERREESIDAGLARLRDRAYVLRGEDLQSALEELATSLRSPSADDDVTALAIRAAPR